MPPRAAAEPADKAAIVARLREHLARVAPARILPGRLPTGIDALDSQTGGWPRPGLSLLAGAPGSGRLGLLLPALGALTRAGRPVAVVDPLGWLHPPGLPGVDLTRLLLVRPGAGRAAWATEQLARCADLDLVALLDPPRLGRAGRRLQHAAEQGLTAVLVLSDAPDPDLPVSLLLEVLSTREVRLVRGGRGRPEQRISLDRPAAAGPLPFAPRGAPVPDAADGSIRPCSPT